MSNWRDWNWIFKGYVNNGTDLIQVWYDGETAPVRAGFDVLLQGLRHRANEEWSDMGDSTALKGKNNRGLVELRFHVEKVRYRPIGFFGVGKQTFTLLTVANKSDFSEKCNTARKRKPQVESNPGAYSNESKCLSSLTGTPSK